MVITYMLIIYFLINTLNDFLDYWFHEYHNRQESSRLEPIYMKNHTKIQSGQSPTGVQQEAVERYQKLSYTDKAIYRAVAKEYLKKEVVYVNN